MTTNIWGAENEFWTDLEDEEDAKSENSTVEEPLKAVPEWLQNFEDKRKECEDTVYFGACELFETNSPENLKVPNDRVQPPVDATSHKHIRKKWVMQDSSDVSDFDMRLPPSERAMKHPFDLDDFQKRAILHVEANEHILVCAHTSAGKTVVAEYAIALAERRKLRAIYTSPIKALSNQKYREFCKIFGSVGIVTGDVSVNKEGGQCLIMTTEILRSLLYRNDPLIGQIGCVIFDEVHYINDEDRGVVWEESIILLPPSIPLVMLSATVPNYLEFAEWIGITKQREVFVTHTLRRPVPLKHHIFINRKSYLVMGESCVFNNAAYNIIYTDIRNAVEGVPGQAKAGAKSPPQKKVDKRQNAVTKTYQAKMKSERQHLQEFFEYSMKNDGLPVVVFAFSRRKCEQLALSVRPLPLSASCRSRNKTFIKSSLASLKDEDKCLPQIQMIQELADRGIGVHHGGLLPIVKEMVEIMFSTGMIQILFATETFAMGVNMPARSVLLASLRKYDSRSFESRTANYTANLEAGNNIVAATPNYTSDVGRTRLLKGTEYIQMAGRAGRRGLDTEGNVFIFCPTGEPPSVADVHEVLTSKPHPLQSKFRLTLAMLLSLVTRQSIKPSDLISKSFLECRRAQRMPTVQRDLARAQHQLEALSKVQCIFGIEADIENYVDSELHCRELSTQLYTSLYLTKYRDEIFCPGRVVLVHSLYTNSIYGAILSSEITHDHRILFRLIVLITSDQKSTGLCEIEYEGLLKDDSFKDDRAQIIEDAIRKGPGAYLSCDRWHVIKQVDIQFIATLMNFSVSLPKFSWDLNGDQHAGDVSMMFGDIPMKIGKKKGKKAPSALKEEVVDDKIMFMRTAVELDSALASTALEPYTLSPKVKQLPMPQVLASAEHSRVAAKLIKSRCHHCPEREKNMSLRLKELKLLTEIEDLKHMVSTESLELMPDFDAKLFVLKKRKFVSEDNAITLKGRAACEMLAADEIALTEALFSHLFQNLSIPGMAAVISPLVYPETTHVETTCTIDAETDAALNTLLAIHAEIGSDLEEVVSKFDLDNWLNLCNPSFAPIAYAWANGVPFAEVVEKSSVHEGTIVRAIIRLDEMVKKMRNVCHIIGNLELKAKFVQVSEAIHRDIVFANSLYLQ